jgi:hypothetical protein
VPARHKRPSAHGRQPVVTAGDGPDIAHCVANAFGLASAPRILRTSPWTLFRPSRSTLSST